MHCLINVSAHLQFYSSEHNLKLQTVQDEIYNVCHDYLDLENYTIWIKKGKLSFWVHNEEIHS